MPLILCTNWAKLDGSTVNNSASPAIDGADSGTSPQFPSLLSGYAAIPKWMVAGVNYGVGLPTGTSLTTADAVAPYPSGSQWDAGGFLRVNKSSGSILISGYDFTTGGILVDTNCKAAVSVTNCMFRQSGFSMNFQGSAGSSLSMKFNTFDGQSEPLASSTLLNLVSNTAYTFWYNRFTKISFDCLRIGAITSFDARYNLFDDVCFAALAHFDCIQSTGAPINNFRVWFNTFYQPNPGSGLSANSFVRIGDLGGGESVSPDMGYNTIILLGSGRCNNVMQITASTGGTIFGPLVHDNYIDPTGITNAIFYPLGSAGNVLDQKYLSNINMLNGAVIAAA